MSGYYGGTAGDPHQIIDSDGDTFVRVENPEGADNDEIEMTVANDRKVFITSTDGFVNGSTPMTINVGGSNTLDVKWLTRKDDSDLSVGIGTIVHTDTPGRGGVIFGGKSRGTEASPTATQDGDTLFDFAGVGHDGTDFNVTGRISLLQDGAGATGSTPGAWGFYLTKPGDNNVTEFMNLSHSGLTVNDGSEAFSYRFETVGDTHALYNDGINDTWALGTSQTSFTVNGLTVLPKMVVDRSGGGSNINFACLSNVDSASAGAFNVWLRARGSGTGPTTYQAVQNGDRLGVFRNDAHDGTEFITSGDFSYTADGAISTGIVPTKFAVRQMDSAGAIFTSFSISSAGRLTFNPDGGTDITLFEDGGIRANQQQNSAATADFIYYTTNYTNGVRIDVSANQFNVANDSNQQGGLLSADIDDGEVVINKFNTDCNLIVEGSSAGVNLFETDTTNDTITQGNTIFDNRYQGNKGADAASSSQVTLGDGNYFDITGTTTIDYLTTTGWQAGSVVTLQFDASVTVTHNTAPLSGVTGPLMLSGSVNFAATANDTLTVVYDGSKWREVARTII